MPQGGSGTPTYDWAASKWLPVGRRTVSPDGSRYAYSEIIPNPAAQGLGGPPPLGTKVHIVDVASHTDTIVYQTTNVLSAGLWDADGIYLTQPVALVDTPTAFHVWLLDLGQGSAKQVIGGNAVGPGDFFIGGGALWILAADPVDPKGAKTLRRVELSGVGQAIWYKQSTAFAQFLGLDADGVPVVSMWSADNGDPGKTYLLPHENSLRLLAETGFVQMSVEPDGLWLNGDGIWFQPAGGTLQKVATARGGFILGACG